MILTSARQAKDLSPAIPPVNRICLAANPAITSSNRVAPASPPIAATLPPVHLTFNPIVQTSNPTNQTFNPTTPIAHPSTVIANPKHQILRKTLVLRVFRTISPQPTFFAEEKMKGGEKLWQKTKP
jgi:hypothetical protein